jgi:hypothetical protein
MASFFFFSACNPVKRGGGATRDSVDPDDFISVYFSARMYFHAALARQNWRAPPKAKLFRSPLPSGGEKDGSIPDQKKIADRVAERRPFLRTPPSSSLQG